MNITEVLIFSELKIEIMKITSQLELDPVYDKDHAINDLNKVIMNLHSLEDQTLLKS